jgi:4-amino-4-deoxy-L-arabinose transferase-like glycosyltransferase
VNENSENTSWRIRNVKIRSGVSFFSSGMPVFGWKLMVFVILLVYVPFLGNRVVRPAGDDKVYVSQAVEMAAQGNWFLHTLGGEPDYYKGPLHYLFLRAGMILFGDSMWATVYMNLLLVILGAMALGAIVHRHMREFDGWAVWTGMAFAVSAGIYSHVFASQMEVENAALFAIGLYFLDRAGPGKADLKFWIVAGLSGWLKSPLHSLLLGLTALIFWAWQKELLPRMRSPGAWLAAAAGVAVCTLGYLPAFLFDQDAFIATYIVRETLNKGANGAPWHYPIIPLFTYSLLPWMLPAFVAYADGISRLWRRKRPVRTTPGARRVMALGIALIIPSVFFFIYHPYRGQNYNLPVIGGLVLWVAAVWATRAEHWSKFYSFTLGLTAVLLLVVPAVLTYVSRHFDPMPFWWPSWLLPVLWIGALLSARGLWREGVTFHMARPASLSRRPLWFFLGLGFFLTVIGEREMVDIRDRIYTSRKESETLQVSYYNLQKNIWSEWGYLNFQIPYPVRGLFSEEQLLAAVEKGDLILVPGEYWLDEMRKQVGERFPEAEWTVEPWRRWKTKGKNADGVPAWKEAWTSRDLSKLERNYYMVRVAPGGR